MSFKGEAEFDRWAVRFSEFCEPGSRIEKEFRLTRQLIVAARRWTTYIDEAVKQRTGHSRARWQTLSALRFSECPVTTLDLADRMAVRWPTLVKVLNELERENLIKREVNPNDKRSRLISITPEGERLSAEVQAILDPLRSGALAKFSDEELVETEAVLDRLFKVLVSQIGAD